MEDIETLRLKAKAKAKAARERTAVSGPMQTVPTAPAMWKMFPRGMVGREERLAEERKYPYSPYAPTWGAPETTLDAFDIGMRGLAEITGQGRMEDVEANIWAKPRQMWRDYMEEEGKKEWGSVAAGVGAPGVTLKTPQSREKEAQFYSNLGDVIFDIVGDPYVAGAMLKRMGAPLKPFIERAGTKPRRALKIQVEGKQKLDPETLEMYGWGLGKEAKAMRAAAKPREVTRVSRLGRETKRMVSPEKALGDELVERIYNPQKYIPEAKDVNRIIGEMGDISTDNVVNYLNNYADEIEAMWGPTERASVSKIRQLASTWAGRRPDAKTFKSMREGLDKKIDFAKQHGLSHYNDALTGARTTMKNDLIFNAPNEYQGLMSDWHEKIDMLDRMKRILGKDIESGKQKSAGFIKNLFGLSKDERVELVKDYDEIFKTDFGDRSRLLYRARELGPSGQPLFETTRADAEWYSLVAGYGSPWMSSKILSTLKGIEGAGRAGFRLGGALSDALVVPAKGQILMTTIENLPDKDKKKIDNLLRQFISTQNPQMKALIQRDVNRRLGGI